MSFGGGGRVKCNFDFYSFFWREKTNFFDVDFEGFAMKISFSFRWKFWCDANLNELYFLKFFVSFTEFSLFWLPDVKTPGSDSRSLFLVHWTYWWIFSRCVREFPQITLSKKRAGVFVTYRVFSHGSCTVLNYKERGGGENLEKSH